MKRIIIPVIFFLSLIYVPAQTQNYYQDKSFSSVYFSLMGGTSFNTIPTAGGSFIAEVKTNLNQQLFLKFNLGYTTLYDDNSYETKYYWYSEFADMYHTRLLAVDRIDYTIIPVNLGAEYDFIKDLLSPFAVLELGYNFSTSKAMGTLYDGIEGSYDTIEEIPEEYRQPATPLDQGSSFTVGAGVGVRYKLTDRVDINLRYVYRYNVDIVNNNQILLGFTF